MALRGVVKGADDSLEMFAVASVDALAERYWNGDEGGGKDVVPRLWTEFWEDHLRNESL